LEVFLADFLLAELEFDAGRVVVRDEGGVSDLVDERFATACEIIGIEEAAGVACNAESNAARASCFSRWLAVQCLPNSRLRLGVKYPGRCRVMTGSSIGAVWLQGVSEAFKVVLGEWWHRKTGKNGGAGNAGKEGW
jgi:hypothetical protein